ncbi:MAG: MFS transporter [Chthoniobacter sp.]
MIVTTLVVGSLTDALGLRRTFFLGVGICLFARAIMALCPVKWVALSGGLFLLAIGEALGTPVLVAATRKYSNTQQRSMSFSLIYVVMNLGFLAANYLYDWIRQGLGEYGHWTIPLLRLANHHLPHAVSRQLAHRIADPSLHLVSEEWSHCDRRGSNGHSPRRALDGSSAHVERRMGK